MPTPEHTDPKALDQFYNLTAVPARPWYRRSASAVWRFLAQDLWREPIEIPSDEGPILRRIKIHELATKGAKRLHKLPREDAADILVVTAMLLGFEDTWQPVRRARGVRR